MSLLVRPPLDCPSCKARGVHRTSARHGSRRLLALLFYSYRCHRCGKAFWRLSNTSLGWSPRGLTAVLAMVTLLALAAGGAWLAFSVLAR